MHSVQTKLNEAIIEKITALRSEPRGITEAQRLDIIGGEIEMRFEVTYDAYSVVRKFHAQTGWTTHLTVSIKECPNTANVYFSGAAVQQTFADIPATRVGGFNQSNATVDGVHYTVFERGDEVCATISYAEGAQVVAVLAMLDRILDTAYAAYVKSSVPSGKF